MIFVDTSFWIALRNRRDAHHEEGVELLKKHADGALLTSSQVRGETWNYLRRRVGHAAAVEFLDSLEHSPRIRVFPVEQAHEESALGWLRRHDEREYSFVDATSFALMRALRIQSTLAFDGDFTAAGFIELRA